MVSISRKYETLQAVDVNSIINESLKELEKFIIELNQRQLYDKGEIDVTDPGIKEFYAKGTIRQKQKKAMFKKTDFITLRWDGAFYESFKLIIFDKTFVISATDLKWVNWLEPNPRFANALGLTEESKGELREIMLPVFLRKLKDEI